MLTEGTTFTPPPRKTPNGHKALGHQSGALSLRVVKGEGGVVDSNVVVRMLDVVLDDGSHRLVQRLQGG